MSDTSGCVVVLSFSDRVKTDLFPESEEPHLTLVYLGNENLDPDNFKDLVEIVRKIATSIGSDIQTTIVEESLFGEDEETEVLEVEETFDITNLRRSIISALTPELARKFSDAETWPDFRPHITYPHGYLDVGSTIVLDQLEVWNGDDRVTFLIPSEELMHYGILRKSGRYPWGSGENPNQRSRSFLGMADDLKKKGLNDVQIAQSLGLSTTELRAMRSIAKQEVRAADASMARMLKEKGLSNIAIGERMGLNESSVRGLLAPQDTAKKDLLLTARDVIRDRVNEVGFLDIGKGINIDLGISEVRTNTAIAMLKEEGYVVFNNIKIPQLTNPGNFTTVKVLAKPGTEFRDVMANVDNIKTMATYSNDGGHTFLNMQPPKSISSKRVGVVYAEDGGTDADGVMYLRPGVKDLSLGKSAYAQVRIAVDGTHYLKGMAMYKDDLPDGVDILFNTNKSKSTSKMDVLKKLKDDPDNPFGSIPKRQSGYLNILSEEGAWADWSKSIASQVLSKQRPEVAKEQLDIFYKQKKEDFDKIMGLTNPVIKKRLLESAADDYDSATVDLKAAAMPRQASHVILPVKSMKETEVFAPNYRNGEKVVLIRYPHGGIFEIPELTVNNRQPEASKMIGKSARDAVGISPKTASKLSGADFDGDTVLVIPNNNKKILSSKALDGLKNFDPQIAYPSYPGMKPMTPDHKQKQMGIVSNLITDMTIKGATQSELARAVRHSMVVIDAEKHKLNYKQSAVDNGIKDLHKKYQGKPKGGASTLISKASGEQRVAERKLRKASQGGSIDPVTGEKIYVYTGQANRVGVSAKTGNKIYLKDGLDYRVDPKTGEKEYIVPGSLKVTPKTIKSTKMAETRDARTLSSGTRMENIYANHANQLKVLANEARKEYISTPPLKYSPEAKVKYKSEVASLNSKLNIALKNKPLERQAQIVANAIIKQKKLENPNIDADKLGKMKAQALIAARERVGAQKNLVYISDKEWEAIQSGAITNGKLTDIVKNSDIDRVRELATPIVKATMTPSRISRAQAMLARGYSRADIADALGISVGTLSEALSD